MHIQRAENILMGYGRDNWHLIIPTKQEYLEAAQVFTSYRSRVGRPIESIEIRTEEINTDQGNLHESWCNAITGVTTQCIWAAKEILSNNAN